MFVNLGIWLYMTSRSHRALLSKEIKNTLPDKSGNSESLEK